MKIKVLLTAVLMGFLLSSCGISYPVLVTENPVGEKVGTASYTVILGFIRPMDADVGIAAAAENGGISEVATVDFKVKGGLFKTTYTTIVTGQ